MKRAAIVVLLALACTAREPTSIQTGGPMPSPQVTPTPTPTQRAPAFEEFDVPDGARPHDVAPAPDGRVWYTAQNAGALGVLTPSTGRARHIRLGAGSRPHGVIVGPDGAPWVTDQGLNAIVRVDPRSDAVKVYRVTQANVGPHTATFDGDGNLWFTGSAGYYGKLVPSTGRITTYPAPRGSGPYGIDATPDGTVWFASLAQSYIARIRASDGRATVFEVPTSGGGARRVWSDSRGVLWVTEWYSGKLARFDGNRWREYMLPGSNPQPYAVYVDERDDVWITDFGANALVRFDPETERFTTFRYPSPGAEVRQLLGRPGEVWGAESGTDKLVVLRT